MNHKYSPTPKDHKTAPEKMYTDVHYRKIYRGPSTMGCLQKDDYPGSFSSASGDVDDRCATTKVLLSRCRTEEVEPGRFIRKCEKSQKFYKDCVGRPSEMTESDKEQTEEDVTDQKVKGSSSLKSAEAAASSYFTRTRSDIEAIERKFFG